MWYCRFCGVKNDSSVRVCTDCQHHYNERQPKSFFADMLLLTCVVGVVIGIFVPLHIEVVDGTIRIHIKDASSPYSPSPTPACILSSPQQADDTDWATLPPQTQESPSPTGVTPFPTYDEDTFK